MTAEKAAGAPKEALAMMICPSGQVISPDRVAEIVLGLFGALFHLETGSALRVGPDGVEPVTHEPVVSGASR